MTTYDWFKERELERIRTSSDFRFTASLYLYVGAHAADPSLQAALEYVTTVKTEDVPAALRKDVTRLAAGQRIMELTDGVLGSDFADALIGYQEAGGSLEQDFSPEWAEGVVHRVLAGLPGTAALPQAA
jgi:hypothetical protein